MAVKKADPREEILGQERVMQQDMRRCAPITRKTPHTSSVMWRMHVIVWIMRAAGCTMNIRTNT